jgi:hypothetical protein
MNGGVVPTQFLLIRFMVEREILAMEGKSVLPRHRAFLYRGGSIC